MLKSIVAYKEWVGRFIIVLTAVAGYLINKYFDWNARLSGLEEGLLYSGLTTIALLCELILTRVHLWSRRVRNLLLGNKNIEGVWIEIAQKKTAKTKLSSIGYCFIRVEDQMFMIDGHAFKFDNRKQDNWKTTFTILNNDGDLDMMYKLSTSKTGTGDIFAYCKYSFTISADNILPDYYSGSYVYPLDNETYFVEGRKVRDTALAKKIQKEYQRDFLKCKELCEQYFPGKVV